MAKVETIVLKIGSSTLTDKEGNLDLKNLRRIVSEIAKSGKRFIVVTSGAVVTGAQKLKLSAKPKSIPEKQAAAAVGQSILMRQYEKAFESYGITVGQILLTKDAISNKERKLNAKNTIHTLLNEGVVPIVNENDTVATDEIRVGDNDTLSAMVATLINADLLILLTDVDGFYIKRKDGTSEKLTSVKKITKEIVASAGGAGSDGGTGGMMTKLQAVKICSKSKIPVIISNGRAIGGIQKIAKGEKLGTLFTSKS